MFFVLLQNKVITPAKKFLLRADTSLMATLTFDGNDNGTSSAASLTKTGGTFTDFTQFIIKLINLVLLYIGIIAVLVVIIAGVTFIISGGNEDLRSRAKRAIVYSVIGLIVILFAKVLVEFFIHLLT